MPRESIIKKAGLGAKLSQHLLEGMSAPEIAAKLLPDIERFCQRRKLPVPKLKAISGAITRWVAASGKADGRTVQGRASQALATLEQEAEIQMITARFDALETIYRYVSILDAEVTELLEAKRKPGFADGEHVKKLVLLSQQVRQWVDTLVDVKDRVRQHQEYDLAFNVVMQAILDESALRGDMTFAAGIAARLQAHPTVAAIMGMGGDVHGVAI